MDTSLLEKLIQIDSPSGNESDICTFLESYVKKEIPKAKTNRVLNNLVVIKGKPEIAIFAHIDTVGFMSGYDNELLLIGHPTANQGDSIENKKLLIEAKIAEVTKKTIKYKSNQEFNPGTFFSFAFNMKVDESNKKIHSAYLDNRLGILNALELLKKCDNIAVAFTSKEEHYGNGARICAKLLYEDYKITKALISDITWTSKHIEIGKGPVVSLRDDFVPNRNFVDKIVSIARQSKISFQMEVENSGRSDGGYIEVTPYPIEWCFVGICIDGYESSSETCAMSDFDNLVSLTERIVKEWK